jgi:hypothetical protein
MTISKIMGTANIRSARPNGASVKSVSTPRTASASSRNKLALGAAGGGGFGNAADGDDSIMVTNSDER